MTHEFTKDISNIDRKLQGRVLEAIRQMVHKRLGDYKLIYLPDA